MTLWDNTITMSFFFFFGLSQLVVELSPTRMRISILTFKYISYMEIYTKMFVFIKILYLCIYVCRCLLYNIIYKRYTYIYVICIYIYVYMCVLFEIENTWPPWVSWFIGFNVAQEKRANFYEYRNICMSFNEYCVCICVYDFFI